MILYRLEGGVFYQRVADRLRELDIEFHSVGVEMRHSQRDRVREVSGQRQVPVLVDETQGATLAESDILEFLEKTYAEEE